MNFIAYFAQVVHYLKTKIIVKHTTGLDDYIVSHNPQSIEDVERLAEEYLRAHGKM